MIASLPLSPGYALVSLKTPGCFHGLADIEPFRGVVVLDDIPGQESSAHELLRDGRNHLRVARFPRPTVRTR